MADHSYLRRVAARELDQAVATLEELLGEESEARDSLYTAQRDVGGRGDPDFRSAVLVGALARVVTDQQRRTSMYKECE